MLCEYRVFGDKKGGQKEDIFRPFCPQAACREVRVSMLDIIITAILAQMSLNDKQDRFGGGWTAHCFYPCHAIRAERIEAHAILAGNQVFSQL